jgi:crossover junction endodeoxyribonuclease RuvC
MKIVAGVDFSLTSTGIAIASGAGLVLTALVSSKGKTADSLKVRCARQEKIVTEVLEHVWDAELVVIEGLFGGANAGALIDRSGGWWCIVRALIHHGVPVVTVAPTSAKKFLSGAGNADKGAMVRAAGKLWPDWEPSSTGKTEDEADAIALVSIGLAVVGEQPFEMTVPRKDLVQKLLPQLEDQ